MASLICPRYGRSLFTKAVPQPRIGTEVRAEAPLDQDVDTSVKSLFQFFDQGQIVAEAAIFGQVDQQIDVTVRTFLVAQH
jgi:hypothetical protein